MVEAVMGMRTRIRSVSENWLALLIGALVFSFHVWHVPTVIKGAIFLKSNLAFDFDIDRFVQLWCAIPFPGSQNEDYYAVRHPLAISVRLVCTPLVHAGLDAHVAASAIAAACAALSAVIIVNISLMLRIRRSIASILALFWSLSTTPLLLGVLPEAYDLAILALTYQFLLSIRWMQGHPPGLLVRVGIAVASFGVTITNVVLSGLVEILCRLARQPMSLAVRGTIGFSASVTVLAVALSIISFLLWPVQNISSPVMGLKQVYWSATSAERTLARQPVGDVAWTFGVTSFVAPAPERYPSGLPSNPYFWDLRGQDYSFIGWVSVLVWLGLLTYGVVAAVNDLEHWPVWAAASLWIVSNIVLHSYWQFRDAVFLYSAHSHTAFFLFALAGATWAQKQRPYGGLAYGTITAVLTALVASNNLPTYWKLSELN